MEQLLKLDEQLFLWLNGIHSPWLDPIMAILTKTQSWVPLYLLLIYLIIKQYKKNSWICLVALTLVVLMTDQVTASIMKPYFERLRPSHEPSLASVIHLVDNQKGGQFGFASSHAANTFGVAMFVWLSLKKSNKFIWLIFAWSIVMSYSRIYLGLHYPGDILVGASIGLLTGWAFSKAVQKLMESKLQPV
jgi:undecaprenyl-diphosphatase